MYKYAYKYFLFKWNNERGKPPAHWSSDGNGQVVFNRGTTSDTFNCGNSHPINSTQRQQITVCS